MILKKYCGQKKDTNCVTKNQMHVDIQGKKMKHENYYSHCNHACEIHHKVSHQHFFHRSHDVHSV